MGTYHMIFKEIHSFCTDEIAFTIYILIYLEVNVP